LQNLSIQKQRRRNKNLDDKVERREKLKTYFLLVLKLNW
jgi:hypothetical protein